MHEGDEQDEARRTARVEQLRQARLAHYRRQGTALEMIASPRRPVAPSADAAGPGVHDDTRPLLGCVSAGLTVVYVGQLIDEALLSRADLVVPLRITFVLAILAAAASVAAMVRLARGKAMAPAEVAVPWQDVVEGVRLGEVEPSNPAWPVAASLVEEVRPVVQAALAQARTEERLARIREAGALVHATAEEWRERQARRPGAPGTALDRLPPLVGPSLEEASRASDESSDAALDRLGRGDHDLDFAGWAGRRAAMYARRTGAPVVSQDPRGPLADATPRLVRERARAAWWRRAYAAGVVVTAGVLLAGHPWWSTVPALATLATAAVLARVSPRDPAMLTTALPPGLAMAWRDYLDAVAYADSGTASVTTVEAIRGCEQRVRALVLELSSPSLSATDAPVLGAELHRLASGAWTLVGQERAEERLLDDPDDPDGLDPGERRD